MQILRRVLGYVLLAIGMSGLVFALVSVVWFQSFVTNAEASVEKRLDVLDDALVTTADGLMVAQTALTQADSSIASLRTTVVGVTQTITDTLPTFDTLSSVVGDDVPQAITTTRQALQSAQSTALIADQVLTTISSIGVINTQLYNPKVPLNVAIGQVASSLEGLPESLKDIKISIGIASGSLKQVQRDIAVVSTSMGDISSSVIETQTVLKRYQATVAALQQELAAAREALPRWLVLLRWGGTLALIWLGAAQSGLVLHGLEILRRARQT
jgi:hypothetical protein